MTTTTTDKEVSPRDALAAAEATYRSTQDAVDRARSRDIWHRRPRSSRRRP